MYYYTIYKTINNVNHKFYIGAHKTKNLNDDYIGSGKILKKAIEKHGIENFSKEILYVFPSKEEMYFKEAELVNEDFVSRKDTYNLKVGGEGGWDHLNQNSDFQKEMGKRGNSKMKWLSENDPTWQGRKNQGKAASKNLKKLHKEGKIKYDTFKGKKHSEKAKNKISEAAKIHQKGEKNSQYGTMWIYNIELRQCKKISKNDDIPKGWEKGCIFDFEKHFEKLKEKEEKLKLKRKKEKEKIDKIKILYELYLKSGLSIRKFASTDLCNISYSRLAKLFRENIPEYKKDKTKKGNFNYEGQSIKTI